MFPWSNSISLYSIDFYINTKLDSYQTINFVQLKFIVSIFLRHNFIKIYDFCLKENTYLESVRFLKYLLLGIRGFSVKC